MKKSILKISIICLTILLFHSCGSSESSENTKAIKGLMPADVHMNFEKQGFKTTKDIGGEYGNSWVSDLEQDGIKFKVQVFSTDVNTVESINATAIINTNNSIEATKDFIKFTATLPYELAKPEEAQQWVEENFNKDGASITIGDAEFKISAPTEIMRQLMITKKQ